MTPIHVPHSCVLTLHGDGFPDQTLTLPPVDDLHAAVCIVKEKVKLVAALYGVDPSCVNVRANFVREVEEKEPA
jgi:hypothetical protein